jgi:hypothetical protein
MTRCRADAESAAVGIPLAVYLIALGMLALWLYSLLQPRQFSNPGLAAYAPPPATVISYEMSSQLLARHWEVPPAAEVADRPEELPQKPTTTVAESKPERTIEVKAPKRSKPAARRWAGGNPFRDYAAAFPRYSGNRPF